MFTADLLHRNLVLSSTNAIHRSNTMQRSTVLLLNITVFVKFIELCKHIMMIQPNNSLCSSCYMSSFFFFFVSNGYFWYHSKQTIKHIHENSQVRFWKHFVSKIVILATGSLFKKTRIFLMQIWYPIFCPKYNKIIFLFYSIAFCFLVNYIVVGVNKIVKSRKKRNIFNLHLLIFNLL